VKPLMLSIKFKTPQICFETLVDHFYLSIILGTIGCDDMQLGSLKASIFFLETPGKSGIMVKNDRLRHAM
jgi:hypothetical protein